MRVAVTLREELLAELGEARRELLSSVEGLSKAQMTYPLAVGAWSAKDVLAHIASWDELRCFEIARVARGDAPLYAGLHEEDFAAWNDLLIAPRRDLPLDQALQELHYAREQVLEMIASVPDDRLAEVARGRVRIRRAAAHDREHTDQIREWRQQEGL